MFLWLYVYHKFRVRQDESFWIRLGSIRNMPSTFEIDLVLDQVSLGSYKNKLMLWILTVGSACCLVIVSMSIVITSQFTLTLQAKQFWTWNCFDAIPKVARCLLPVKKFWFLSDTVGAVSPATVYLHIWGMLHSCVTATVIRFLTCGFVTIVNRIFHNQRMGVAVHIVWFMCWLPNGSVSFSVTWMCNCSETSFRFLCSLLPMKIFWFLSDTVGSGSQQQSMYTYAERFTHVWLRLWFGFLTCCFVEL